MSAKITIRMLDKAQACEHYQLIFAKTFGHGAEVTVENAQRAINAGLHLRWAVRNFCGNIAYGYYLACCKKASGNHLVNDAEGFVETWNKFYGKDYD